MIKGKLLQLLLPCEVRADAANAQRSTLTGRLVVSMPKENPCAEVNIALIRPKQASQQGPGAAAGGMTAVSTTTAAGTVAGTGPVKNARAGVAVGAKVAGGKAGAAGPGGEFIIREVRIAQVQAMDDDDDDYVPDL